MRHWAHVFLVWATSAAIVLATSLGGNVLCFGDDGHVAVESPHQGQTLVLAVSPAPHTHPELAADHQHGACHDLALEIELAARQDGSHTANLYSAALPLSPIDCVPPATLTVQRGRPAYARAIPAKSTEQTCLRSTVLLI